MRTPHGDGMPIGRPRRNRRSAERRAIRDAIWFALVFGAVALINAILGLALIEALGFIDAQAPGSAAGAAACSRRVGRSAAPADT
jgi:hypothetical protein